MANQNKKGPFRLSWIIDEAEDGDLLRTFLSERGISKRALTAIKFDGGRITVNESEVNVRYILKARDRVEAIFPVEIGSDGLLPEMLPLTIKYEDEYVMVLVKAAGMSTIPSREHPSGSLANALLGYYSQEHIDSTAHIVTRLDRDTSGLVLIAKHSHVHHLLCEQQKKGQVKRRYEAIVEGEGMPDNGMIEAPIGRKLTSIIEREIREDGRYACTKYVVLQRGPMHTHIALQLLTGRTHQIRVHMAYSGFPLAGDDLYGGHLDIIPRQALHCSSLKFIHPFTGEQMSFEEMPPRDFRNILENFKPSFCD